MPRTRAVISSSGDSSREAFSPCELIECEGAFGGARSLTMAPRSRSRRAVESLRRVLVVCWRGAGLEKSGFCFDERVVRGLNAKRAPGLGFVVCDGLFGVGSSKNFISWAVSTVVQVCAVS